MAAMAVVWTATLKCIESYNNATYEARNSLDFLENALISPLETWCKKSSLSSFISSLSKLSLCHYITCRICYSKFVHIGKEFGKTHVLIRRHF